MLYEPGGPQSMMPQARLDGMNSLLLEQIEMQEGMSSHSGCVDFFSNQEDSSLDNAT